MSKTPLVSRRSKLWGLNRHLLSRIGCELHHATIEPGGYSSRHFHATKDNHFYVVSGRLYVEFYLPDATKAYKVVPLDRGDQLIVPAGEWHRFVNDGEVPVELLETYWADPEKLHDDIVRADVGGKLVR